MTDFVFDSIVALDPVTGYLSKLGVGQVYAEADFAAASPLPIRDASGVSKASVNSGPQGVLEVFVTTDQPRVWWVSGGFKILLTSSKGLLDAAQAAAASAAAAADAAASATSLPTGGLPGQVVTVGSDMEPHWMTPASGSGAGISGAPIVWPVSFPPSAHTHPAGDINDSSALGRQIIKSAAPGDVRTAIGAAPSSVVSWPGNGTTADKTAAGSHTHAASTVSFTPTGTVTATNVQDAIAQAATTGTGGGGGGVTVSSGTAVPDAAVSTMFYVKTGA